MSTLFSGFVLNNTDTFRDLQPEKSKHFFRVYINEYWYLQSVTTKL